MRLDEAYERQALQRPHDVAVVSGADSLTFEELDRRATGLAGVLASLGVAPEALVGLYVRRSINLAIGTLGIVKAGGVCVPLDASYPGERVQLLLEKAQPSLLLVEERVPHYVGAFVPRTCLHARYLAATTRQDYPYGPRGR